MENQPGCIDSMWMSAFLQNTETKKKKISHHTKQQRVITNIRKLPKLKGLRNHKLKSHLQPYIDEMIRSDKPRKYHKTSSSSNFPTFKSYHLEKIFEIQIQENMAASKIQKCWLLSKYIYFLRYTCKAIRMVVRIQRIIRGYLCRKRVALYYISKTNLMITLQSHIRKWLSNLNWKRQHILEKNTAKKLQRWIRNKINQSQQLTFLYNEKAVKIQSLWRGLLGRTYTDRLWLDFKIILIQKYIRQYLSKKYVQYLRITYIFAANKIKSTYRHYYCCKLLATKLIDREKNYRMDLIASLTAEENLVDEHLIQSATRFLKYNYREEIRKNEKNMKKLFYEIDLREHDYAELKRQKDILSPLAIQQGWVAELEHNTSTTKSDLLLLKQTYIFQTVRKVEEVCYESERHAHQMLELINRINSLELWKTQEIEDRLEWNFKRKSEQKRYLHRMAIGEEKRKWTVQFYTHSGKPDIQTTLRRQANMMMMNSSNNNSKNGFQGGAKVADIFAKFQQSHLYQQESNNHSNSSNSNYNNNNNHNHNNTSNNNNCSSSSSSSGSRSSHTINDRIQNNLESVNLQTFQNQVDMYAELLKPISSVMERSMLTQPQQLGYGKEGVEYAHAIQNIQSITNGNNSSSSSSSSIDDDDMSMTRYKQLSIGDEGMNSNSSTSSMPSSSRLMNNKTSPRKQMTRPSTGVINKQNSLSQQLNHHHHHRSPLNNNDKNLYNDVVKDGSSLVESSLSSSSSSLTRSARRDDEVDNNTKDGDYQSSSSSSSSSSLISRSGSSHIQHSTSNSSSDSTTMTSKLKKIKFDRTAILRQRQQRRRSMMNNTNGNNNNNNTTANNSNNNNMTNGRTIPWDLLDELDAEKKKFEMERFSTAMNLKLI